MESDKLGTLDITGVIISFTGVILSLLLFNASINNQRKIILNKVLSIIESDLFLVFNPFMSEDEKIKLVDKFFRAFYKIHGELNQISFDSETGIPVIPQSISYKNDKTKHKYNFNEALENMVEYFESRKIVNIDLLFDYHRGSFNVQQVFSKRISYKRFLLIGPIIGLKIYFKRMKPVFRLNKKTQIPITVKTIENRDDLKEFYDKTYIPLCKIDPTNNKPESFERQDYNIIKITEKGKEDPLKIYV